METHDAGPVLLLTALSVEYQAIRAQLAGLESRSHPGGTRFEVGRLPGGGEVAIAQFGEGNFRAAVLTERSIAMFRPRAVIFVGVAGALKARLKLGDVVVATKVYGYEGGSHIDGAFHSRPGAWEADHDLEQLARQLEGQGEWTRRLPPELAERQAKVHFEPIASGSVLLNSREGYLADQLRQFYNDAAAIEMEGAGVAQAGQLNRSHPVLTVRGISDRADGNKDGTDEVGWQPIAAANAAAFALALAEALAGDQGDEPERAGDSGAGLAEAGRQDYDLVQDNEASGHGRVAAAQGGSVQVGDSPPVSSASVAPGLSAELGAITRQAAGAAARGAPEGPWKQTNVARDSGIVFAAQGGDVHYHSTDPERGSSDRPA